MPPPSKPSPRATDATPLDIAAWVARAILPHEGIVRNWLARRWGRTLDVDDVLQEAYCRLSELDSVAHIHNGRAYFFATARAVAIDMTRAAKVVNVRNLTEIDWEDVMDEGAQPDRVAEAGQTLLQVDELLSRLSWTGRQVIELRRIHGLSQAETAQRLGVTENVVENHIVRGLRSLLKAIEEQAAPTTQCKGEPGWTPTTATIKGTNRLRTGRRRPRSGG